MTTATQKTPEQIEQEMTQTRESITEKVTSLENQVVGTVRSAADTLTDTVDAVKSLVTDAPEAVTQTVKQAATAVSETVKNTFDLSRHVHNHPWGMFAGSVGLGCLVGWLTSRGNGSTVARGETAKSIVDPPSSSPVSPSTPKPGMLDELMGMMGDKVRDLARTALESASTALSETIREELPHFVSQIIRE